MPTNTLTRKNYRRSEYLYIAANYRHHSAPALASALGRTPSSLYRFIARHPELRKQGRM
jgi:hypothetical protein